VRAGKIDPQSFRRQCFSTHPAAAGIGILHQVLRLWLQSPQAELDGRMGCFPAAEHHQKSFAQVRPMHLVGRQFSRGGRTPGQRVVVAVPI
jgi:hypothetical protein